MTDRRERELERAALATMAPDDLRRLKAHLDRVDPAGWDEWCREHIGRAHDDLCYLRTGDRWGFQRSRTHILHPLALVNQTLCNKTLSAICSRWWGERDPADEPYLCLVCSKQAARRASNYCATYSPNQRHLWAMGRLSLDQQHRLGLQPIFCMLGEHDWSGWHDGPEEDTRFCLHGSCPAVERGQVSRQGRLFA